MSVESSLPVSREWLCRRVVEQIGEAIVGADTDGVIRLWNRGAEEIFGYTREEAVGESLDLIVPEEYRDAHWQGFDAAIERGETTKEPVARTRVPALRKGGDRIRIESSGSRVISDDGTPVAVFTAIRDVTDDDPS